VRTDYPARSLASRRVARPRRLHLVIALALAASFVAGVLLQSTFARSETTPTAMRSALAQTDRVQGAPGRTLVLSRVLVEPGASLALHHHLGTQVARVQAGVLRYTVRRGSVAVRRGESDQQPRVVRTIEAGQTGSIGAGEWIVEQPSVIHQAANRGTTPIVIYLATLLQKGAPPSTPVTPPAAD
jgi:quercetin dioxygenase-like cupin family protein